jgi:glutamate dehydrogenase (NAD(P)+)
MIPKRMESFLKEKLPDETWENRLRVDGGRRYLEFSRTDVDQLARLGVEVDDLGPRLVVCMWDEESQYEIGGYLVIDNLAMGRPSMGGIRMLPDVTPSTIHNLARGMTLKNAASDLPYGGGKSGIVARRSLTPQEHDEVVRGFAHLIYAYHDVFLPGPDVGTDDADMKIVAIENGLDNALSKPVEMGGNQIVNLGATAGGLVIALQALLEEMPRLKVLSQFADLHIPSPEEITVLIQGFGAVGAHVSRILEDRIPGARVVGISDALGYLYDRSGLPVERLFRLWLEQGRVTQPFYQEYVQPPASGEFYKYSNAPNDLLRESAFCLIPATPVANYLDIDSTTHPSITVDKMGDWRLIIEGANTYSPDKLRRAAKARLERVVYREKGVLIATDYLVNSGGVIYAAQEHLIKTPYHLRIPDEMLGDRSAVEQWLNEHRRELTELAEKRRIAGEAQREKIIRRNMKEFIDQLIMDPDMLPCEAAERISVRRVAAGESERTAADIMIPMPSISLHNSIQEAASMLYDQGSPIIAVVAENGELVGVVTEWDITRAMALGLSPNERVVDIMTREVVSAIPSDNLLDVIRKLEYHRISAIPVVDQGSVIGMVSTDILARKSLLRLLKSRT